MFPKETGAVLLLHPFGRGEGEGAQVEGLRGG